MQGSKLSKEIEEEGLWLLKSELFRIEVKTYRVWHLGAQIFQLLEDVSLAESSILVAAAMRLCARRRW